MLNLERFRKNTDTTSPEDPLLLLIMSSQKSTCCINNADMFFSFLKRSRGVANLSLYLDMEWNVVFKSKSCFIKTNHCGGGGCQSCY